MDIDVQKKVEESYESILKCLEYFADVIPKKETGSKERSTLVEMAVHVTLLKLALETSIPSLSLRFPFAEEAP